jgi:uncharacterized membrane protein YoaK (UPF0700 family)
MREPRSSRPSIAPPSAPTASLAPRPSLLPTASLHVHSVLLSAVAGYVDAAGFASLIGLLPAHVTGELVDDAVALSSGRAAQRVHLWVLPVFLGSVVIATLAARLLRRRGQRPLAGLLALVTLALAAFAVSDPIASFLGEVGRMPILFSGGCAVAAMGFQNALMRESLKTSCPTTVMTGNLTQVVVDLADRALGKLLRPSPYDRRTRSRLGPVSAALGAFLACAVLGGWLTRMFGSCGAILPTLVTGTLAFRAWREDRVALAPTARVVSAGTPRLPTFETAHVWPESLMPGAPTEPISVSQVRSAPVLPPALDTQNNGPVSGLIVPPHTPNRAAQERRTISGTQLAQRFRSDDDDADDK